MIGRTFQHYEIVETLGRGGMGVVYKARDTHLDRFVAIKVLPPEKVADPERKRRFVQEAKAASALNHPNIVHIYDIAEADGIQFIAMEYVRGKTLDQIIGRKGLRVNETLKYAVQIADPLSKAHWLCPTRISRWSPGESQSPLGNRAGGRLPVKHHAKHEASSGILILARVANSMA